MAIDRRGHGGTGRCIEVIVGAGAEHHQGIGIDRGPSTSPGGAAIAQGAAP